MSLIQELFANDHAEKAPELDSGGECWYSLIFELYNPRNQTA